MSQNFECGLTQFTDDYADSLASAYNFPTFNEYYDQVNADDETKAKVEWLAENYGRDIALKALICLTAAQSAGFVDYTTASAQTYDNEVPAEDIYLNEIQAAETDAAEILKVDSVEHFIDLIREGLSSKAYKLEITEPDVYVEVSVFLNKNPIYFSTGNRAERLTPELINEVFGSDFNFVIIHDTQGVRNINESRQFIKRVNASNVSNSAPVSSTQSIDLPGGVIKETTTITDTSGNITTTIDYQGPWTANEANTVVGDALIRGRSMLATRPVFLLSDPLDPKKPALIKSLFAIYTGGHMEESVVPSFKHQSISNSGSYNYHGEVIAQVLLAGTSDVENLVVISVDSTGFYGVENGFSVPFIKLIDEANSLGAGHKVFINESISGAVDRMNEIYAAMEKGGIKYEGRIYTTVSAGNENKVVSWETKYPNELAQVVALEPGTNGLTGYSNYNISGENLIGETGRFYAITPVIDALGNLVYLPEGYNGTSMASPVALAKVIRDINHGGIISATFPSLFPEIKDIIFMGEINGGRLENIGRLNDPILNSILGSIPGNPALNNYSSLVFDANWSTYNGRYYKFNMLNPAINMQWVDFLRQQNSFTGSPAPMSFYDYYAISNLAVINSVDGTLINSINRWKEAAALARIKELEAQGLLPAVQLPQFQVKQITQKLRVGSGVLPDFSNVSMVNFDKNAALIKEKFDPEFNLSDPEEDLSMRRWLFPIIMTAPQ